MINACNNFVWVVRDETENEAGGMLLPDTGKEKPHYGKIFSVGQLVGDKKIRKDKKAVFHKGNGFDIEYKGQTYLVIEGERIIGVE